MFARVARSVVLSLLFLTVAAAQMPPYLPSNDPDANRLLADRVRFVREMYQLDKTTTDKLVQDLMALVPFQEKYLKDAAKTVYRTELAITIVSNDPATPEAEKPVKLERFKSQLAGIYAKAPLSLANVIRMVDTAVAPEKAAAARTKMAARFAPQLKGASFEAGKIDGLLLPPVKVASAPPVITPKPAPQVAVNPAPTPPPANPAPSAAVANNAATPRPSTEIQPAAPTARVPLANVLTPPGPPQPQRPIPPAPALDQWQTNVEKTLSSYGFSAEQRKIAERALAQCKSRAETQKTQNKSQYEEAQKIGDEKARASKINELNKPVDMVYDELMQRVESIASMEQKAKVKPAASAPAGK